MRSWSRRSRTPARSCWPSRTWRSGRSRPYETLNSILPGYTRESLRARSRHRRFERRHGRSVAASFGAVGLGSDTGNSIRGPSSHQALVGIRSTMGLTSRGGVMPLNLLADVAGPMARTVEDAVAVFQVVVGSDPADPVTAAAASHLPQNYAASLVRDGLKGARIGVLRFAYERDSTDPEIVSGLHARGRGSAAGRRDDHRSGRRRGPRSTSAAPQAPAVHGFQVRHQSLLRVDMAIAFR